MLMTYHKRAGLAAVFAVLLCGLPLVASGLENSRAVQQQPLSLPSYIGELNRWASAVESLKADPEKARQLRQQLPQRWPVVAGPRPIEVSTSWLRAGLNTIAKDPKSTVENVGPLLAHLRALRRDAQDFSQGNQYPDGSAPRKLDEILARPEFNGVRGPTWFDRLVDRIQDWLAGLIEKFGTGLTGHQQIVNVMFWALLVGAAGTLLVWMARRLLQRSETQGFTLTSSGQGAARSSRNLAHKAGEAAARGDFREATRFAYWAAIHGLEEAGLWNVDHTRTHREYLRLIGSEKPQREPLAALTRQFEHVWYAVRPASEDDFQITLEQLEKLGCALPWERTTNRS